jgi:hypothetical protein
MGAPRGGPKHGGRVAGTPNKATVLRREALDQAYAKAGFTPEQLDEITPLRAMLMCMHWAIERKDIQAVLAAASAAAPYVHPRLTSAEVRVSGELTSKSTAELEREYAELQAKITAAETVH